MTMSEWAEKEIEIAKKDNSEDGDELDGYVCGCYESALKAFKSLCEDGHSGMSIQITISILDRLVAGKPLTAIEDTADIWDKEMWHIHEDGTTTYQCKRMFSLFKDVSPNGDVKYRDSDRVICVDVNDGVTYSLRWVNDIIDEMFPITMPYNPTTKPIKVYCEDFLTDPEHGDFDTVGVLYAVFPDGTKHNIERYFAERNDGKGFRDIPPHVYYERKLVRIAKD